MGPKHCSWARGRGIEAGNGAQLRHKRKLLGHLSLECACSIPSLQEAAIDKVSDGKEVPEISVHHKIGVYLMSWIGVEHALVSNISGCLWQCITLVDQV